VLAFRQISTRHYNFLTNGRVTFGVLMTCSCTFDTLQAEFCDLFLIFIFYFFDITSVVFQRKWWDRTLYRKYFRKSARKDALSHRCTVLSDRLAVRKADH